MVEPVQAAAVADELSLLDFIELNPIQQPCRSNPSKTSAAFLRNPNLLLLDDLLDSSVDSFLGLSPLPPPPKNSPSADILNEGEAEEEEELEWLANKDAFPSLETSFAITSASPVSVLPPSFKVPVKARSKLRRKRRRIFPPPSLLLPPPPPPPEAKVGKERRRCRHCEVEATPQWRMGPEGPKTLCNACGVRYTKGRLFPEYRPANSPTFSAAIHSNSTRKIMEMRLRTARPRKRGRPRVAVM